jgi:hypothetical protein
MGNCATTKAVVAICVESVPVGAVGAVGVPDSIGDALKTTLPVPVELAVTASEGVMEELVTVGTSHAGQLPEGAPKLVTVPPPEHPRLAQAVVAVVVSKFQDAVMVPNGPICTEYVGTELTVTMPGNRLY